MSSVKTIIFFFIALFIYTKFAGPISFSINSVQTNKDTAFRVEGVGKATAVPDTALINVGITKSAPTVLDAQTQANTAANKIIDVIKELGIEEKNIKTTNYSVSPNYNFVNGSQTANGYTVTQTIEVKVSPIEKANRVVDLSTGNGGNLIGGITFTLNDDLKKKTEEKARTEAVQQAKAKAESLAHVAGIKLGRIIDIQESQTPGGIIQPMALGAVEKDVRQTTTLNPGENTVSITVTLSYETY